MKYYVTAWLGGTDEHEDDVYETFEEAKAVVVDRNGHDDPDGFWVVMDENNERVMW